MASKASDNSRVILRFVSDTAPPTYYLLDRRDRRNRTLTKQITVRVFFSSLSFFSLSLSHSFLSSKNNNHNNKILLLRSSPASKSTSSPLKRASRSGPATGCFSLRTSLCLRHGSQPMSLPLETPPLLVRARCRSSSSSGRSPGPATPSGSRPRSRPWPIWARRSSKSTSAAAAALAGSLWPRPPGSGEGG